MRGRVKRLHTRVLVLVGAPKASIGFPVPAITNRRRGDKLLFWKRLRWRRKESRSGTGGSRKPDPSRGSAGLERRKLTTGLVSSW